MASQPTSATSTAGEAAAFHRSVGWRELMGIAAIVAGLAGFFAAASPALGTGQPTGRAWLAVSLASAACVLALVAASRAGPRWWRAAALGAASAVLFACNAALTKTLTALLHHGGWVHVFGNWDPYALGLTGACGLFLLQSALHAVDPFAGMDKESVAAHGSNAASPSPRIPDITLPDGEPQGG